MVVSLGQHLVASLDKGFRGPYVDVLQGTSLENHGKDKGFGLYVVRQALPVEVERDWADDCRRMFEAKAGEPGGSKLGSKRKFYSTVQAVLNGCCCKYEYEGASKHIVNKLYEGTDNGVCQVLLKSLEWTNQMFGVEKGLQFNEIVANQYVHNMGEYVPWHSDKNSLFANEPVIASITLGAPGVFCFAPLYGSNFANAWNFKKTEQRKQNYNDLGVRGCVALWPGDVMIMCGT